MALNNLIDAGLMRITKTGDYDTTFHAEPYDFDLEWGINQNRVWVNLESFGKEGTAIVNYNPSRERETIRTHGRLCFYVNGTGYIYRGRFYYVEGDTTLKAVNINGEPVDISSWYYFRNNDGVTYSYSGSDEDVINLLNNLSPFYIFQHNIAWEDYTKINGEFINLFANIPVFDDIEYAHEYIRTGDTSHALNVPDAEDVPEDLYYYVYNESTVNKLNNSVVDTGNTANAYFKLAGVNDVIAFVKKENTDNEYYLKCTADSVLTYNATSGDYTTVTDISDIAIDVIDGFKNLSGANKLHGLLETNIQKVNTLSEVVPNYNGTIDNSFNGIDNPMELTTLSSAHSFIKPYLLSASELDMVSDILFYSDESFIESLKKGLWMYSENPINAVIDLCYYPIDLSVFIDNTRPSNLKFGAFKYLGQIEDIPKTLWTLIRSTHKTYTLVNQRINAIYNDFRDITNVSYTLFLPFYGNINLDNVVVNKTLKVDSKFDMYTGQLKYYIFVNNSLYSSVECAIGRHIAMLGTDWISKSSKNIEAGASMITNAVSGGVNAYAGNVGGTLGNVGNILQAYKGYSEKPNVQTAGSRTAGLNIYDPLSCFLIVEQYETIKPTNLNSEYGKPTYYISTINKCKGYTEIADIKLKSRALDTEQEEIIDLLKNGVII